MKFFDIATALRSSASAVAGAVRRRLSGRAGSSGSVGSAGSVGSVGSVGDDAFEDTLADPSGWQTVTILAEPHDVAPDGRLPAPLAELGDLIETRLEPAPGDRGSQLSARTRPGPRTDPGGWKDWKGQDPMRRIRTALQQARQLVEAGEVLRLEPQPAGKRRPTRGLLVDLMVGDANQEGMV